MGLLITDHNVRETLAITGVGAYMPYRKAASCRGRSNEVADNPGPPATSSVTPLQL